MFATPHRLSIPLRPPAPAGPPVRAALALSLLVTLAAVAPAVGAAPPCRPCAGITVATPADALAALRAAPALAEEARLYVRFPHAAAEPFDPSGSEELVEAGATPWIAVSFGAAVPLVEHVAELEEELAGLAALVRDAGHATHFEIVWQPADPAAGQAVPANVLADYGFLLKRAAVAITGARSDARVLTQPLPPDPEALRALYGQEIAAYVDGITLQGPVDETTLRAAVAAVEELDPGRPVVVAGLPWPQPGAHALADAARLAAAGASLSLFDPPAPLPSLAPLVVLANEFQGDLSYDPTSAPTGAEAWAFVRGSDLGLRVVARLPPGAGAGAEMNLAFSDPLLASPESIDLPTGRAIPVPIAPGPVRLRLIPPESVAVLRLSRAIASDLETVTEQEVVATEREMPVEEILRRLQAFEDAQARRLDHYQGVNTTHLRFQGAGEAAVEVTFRGPIFHHRDGGYDWAWRELFINGVRWREERLPEIPLIQPEKAAALPLEILFTREYTYRLRGSDTVEGRPAWVVDFEPADPAAAATGKLYQGTVWIDREHYGRLRTRALQVGLTGEVISNEETLHYAPRDAEGREAAWTPEAFWLPVRLVGQQILTLINVTTVIERENLLTDLVLNGPDFDEQLAAVQESDVTMVRDTDKGLRYLVKEEGVEGRVVKEGYDTEKLFLLGGLFHDDALDYPLPLAGINWFSFDLRGTGAQANVFFAGALLRGDIAQPKLFGTRWDAGADLFLFALPFSDEVFRGDDEVEEETVEQRAQSLAFKLGYPIGNFVRIRGIYDLTWLTFGDADETADEFVLPQDHLLHSFELDARYSRAGYRLSLTGSFNQRSSWERWGMPDAAFDPDTEDFLRYDVRFAKSWHLPRFQRLGLELDWVSGEDLDRFSKYQFGFFGATRVHGYSSAKVRAEEATLAHVSYGIGLGELLRLDLVADAAWATDEESALRDELLGGVGLAGSFVGPWRTLVQLDVGVPVAGPDDGFVAYVAFLKLFG